jgi:hypothetical protein
MNADPLGPVLVCARYGHRAADVRPDLRTAYKQAARLTLAWLRRRGVLQSTAGVDFESAEAVIRPPRPLLTSTFHSELLPQYSEL